MLSSAVAALSATLRTFFLKSNPKIQSKNVGISAYGIFQIKGIVKSETEKFYAQSERRTHRKLFADCKSITFLKIGKTETQKQNVSKRNLVPKP